MRPPSVPERRRRVCNGSTTGRGGSWVSSENGRTWARTVDVTRVVGAGRRRGARKDPRERVGRPGVDAYL